jgi:hypothetical protein
LHKNATTSKNGNPKHPSINKISQNPSRNLKFNTTKTILQKPNNQNPTKKTNTHQRNKLYNPKIKEKGKAR